MLQKNESVFFKKTSLINSYFSKCQVFYFFPKSFTIKVQKTFSRNNTICYALFTQRNFATFAIFEKIRISFKTKRSYVFEKSYNFSLILRQMCYILVINNFQSQSLSILPGQVASNRKKTQLFERMFVIAKIIV